MPANGLCELRQPKSCLRIRMRRSQKPKLMDPVLTSAPRPGPVGPSKPPPAGSRVPSRHRLRAIAVASLPFPARGHWQPPQDVNKVSLT